MEGITVVGTFIKDSINVVEKFPNIGTLTNIKFIKNSVGGACNLIIALAKLDKKLDIIASGVVGKNDGDFIIESMNKYKNINTSNIIKKKGVVTAYTVVIDSLKDKQRTFFHYPGSNAVMDIENIFYGNSKLFILEYLLLMPKLDSKNLEFGTRSALVLKKAKDRGMITAIDVVSGSKEQFKESVVPALKYTDICVINELEATGITGICLNDFEKNGVSALKKIKELGVSKWIVIHTPKLSYGLNCTDDSIEKIKSATLPDDYVVGTTGAGDAYCSGIIHTAYNNGTLREAMYIANACAVASLSELNGTDGIKDLETNIENYKKYDRR